MDALIFIDTNIFLDFYRIERKDVSLDFLKNIDEHHDRMITGSQVEMEYKKNRQKVILELIKSMKSVDWNSLATPAILADSQPVKMLQKRKDEINKQQKTLKEKVVKIFKSPSTHDRVYKSLNNLFKTNSDYNLNRENKKKYDVIKLAEKRFLLGYPPRKEKDNSIGDAINWEWIIKCAVDSGKDIIIVTRDGDYGEKHDRKLFLNDWLLQEFKERVGKRRKIILTDSLSEAFKKISLAVTREMEKEEERIIEEVYLNLPAGAGSKIIHAFDDYSPDFRKNIEAYDSF
jgi:predicted nucleic acid-binding protein